MTDQPIECEIWIAMNEDGGYVVVTDEGDALSELGSCEGGYHARVVKLVVKMSPPKPQQINIDVPETAGETATIEVAS